MAFVIYEKKEEEIDNLALQVFSAGGKLKSRVTENVSSLRKQQ